MARSLGTLTLDLVLNLAGFKQGMDRAARETERGAKRIQQNLIGLQRSFATAGRVLGAFGVGFGVSSIISGLTDATKEAIEFGDEIGKAMAKTGIGAETLTELAFAAEQSEVELQTLTTGLRNMQVVISDAAAGNKAAIQTLKDLGLTAKELQALAPEDQFELIAQRLSEFGDEADRAALRQDIFKRSGEALAPVLDKGARGIRELRDAAHELGATLTDEQAKALAETDKALDELSSAYAGLKRSMSAAIAPELTDFFTGLTDAITGNSDEVLTLGDRWTALAKGLQGGFFVGPIRAMQELGKAAREARTELEAIEITATPIGTRTRTDPNAGKDAEAAAKRAASAAEQARKSILDLIVSLEQQASVTGETEEATIRYRIAFGDLVDDFKKAGPAFEERKQQLIDAAAAADQFKAGEELRKANEQIAQQVIDLQAQRIALDEGAAAAFRFSAQHGELAKTLDLATDSQAEFTDAVEEGANARANLELQTAITALDGLVRSTEEATQAIIANAIAEEQGAVAAIRYRIAQGDLKDEFDRLGPAAAEWQKKLEAAAAAQEVLTQQQADLDASESIIPSRTEAVKEYEAALRGLNVRLAEGEISQREFDQAVKIAEKNFKEATKAVDELSVFAEEAARNMQDAFADFLFDPFEDGLEGMVNGFADTLRRMAAEIVAANLAELLNFEDLFKGGGIFGGGSAGGLLAGAGAGAGLSPIAITAQPITLPGAAAAVGEVAGESAAAAAFTAAGTAAAAALTTAGTTAAAAFTTAGTTAATALGTTGTTVASAIIAAGTTAAAAIGAAATAGSAASGLSEIVITAAMLAEGGKVRGSGTAKSDSVPAMLSAGEFVVKAEAVRQPGVERLLTEINNRTTVIKGFATGGHVTAPLMAQAPRSPGKATDERHRTFEAHTSRTAVEDVHRLLREDRHSTIERLLERTAAPIIVDLRQHGFTPLGDLRRSPDEFERLLARLGLLRKAEGGKVFGPGTATSDSIPAWLSAGEFVVRAEAVRKPGVQELLEKLNARGGVFKGFATGGYVYAPHSSSQVEQHFAAGGLVQASATPMANAAPTIVNQAITINAPTGQVSRATQMQVTAAAARGAKSADRHNN